MGFACCVFLANYYLYYYEQKWVRGMLSAGSRELVDRFDKCVCRYIDDILVVDFPEFAELYPDIYPAYLKLGLEHVASSLPLGWEYRNVTPEDCGGPEGGPCFVMGEQGYFPVGGGIGQRKAPPVDYFCCGVPFLDLVVQYKYRHGGYVVTYKNYDKTQHPILLSSFISQ